MQRRLAAIVHADLAGFTRMMEGAEPAPSATSSAQIDVWRRDRGCGGRMVGTAVTPCWRICSAVPPSRPRSTSRTHGAVHEALQEEQRMLFRVGVHLGEVIVDEEDQNIFGDGVNLAARIQAIAEPGGIAVSRAARDVAALKIDYAFIDGGERQFKNVSRPVQIFHVRHAVQASSAEAAARTTTRLLPQITLRFEGADSTGKKYGFDVALDKLMGLPQGMVIGRAADQCDLVVAHATVSRRHARVSASPSALCRSRISARHQYAVKMAPPLQRRAGSAQTGAKLRLGDVDLAIRQA